MPKQYHYSPCSYTTLLDNNNSQVYLRLSYSETNPLPMHEIICQIFELMKNPQDILMRGNDEKKIIDFYILNNTNQVLLIKRFNELVTIHQLLDIFKILTLEDANDNRLQASYLFPLI